MKLLRELERVGGDAVRRPPLGRLGELVREREQTLEQRPLRGVQRLGRLRFAQSASRDAVRAGPRQHRGDPGVRVLDVVDGVVGALAHRQVEVEVDRRVVRAREQEEARRVDADLVDQLVERHVLALALGHRRAALAADQVDELLDHSISSGVAAERLARRPHPRDVAVVVGAPDVDQPLEAARALVLEVGDVGA